MTAWKWQRCLSILSVLWFAGLASASGDLRLVEAVKNRNPEVARVLLKQHVDVNAAEGDGATALAWAAHWDDLETAQLLVRGGANANAANDYGVSPLFLACTNRNAAMAELLLKAGANPNATLPTGETPLMTAARTGDVEVVKAVLAHGAQVNAKENWRGQTALMWAVAERHPDVVRALIDHGADVEARSKSGFTAFLFAAQQGDLDSGRILLAAGAKISDATDDGTALVIATASGHEAFSIFLLDNGADPNAADRYGAAALHYAILKGLCVIRGVRFGWQEATRPDMVGLVKALLAHGADPNARIAKAPLLPGARNLFIVSTIGATPFLLAAGSYDADLMRFLVSKGADPLLAGKDNTTPLIVAAGLPEGLGYLAPRTAEDDKNALEAVKVAVEMGNDVNATTTSGDSAMHGAAYVGSDAIIQFLADKGAKVNTFDSSGQTPWTIAEKIFPPTLLNDNLRPQFVHKTTSDLLLKLGAARMEFEHQTAVAPVVATDGNSIAP